MAVTKVIDIVRRVERILNDDAAVRWTRLEIQDWLNDAYKEIVLLRPDANSYTSNVMLASGTRQKIGDSSSINLPAAIRILDVIRNTAALSNKKGIMLISRKILDEQYPFWHSSTGSVNITHWVFDLRAPKEFFVFPPSDGKAEVEILYSSVPTPHALSETDLNPTGTNATTILLDDIYANAITDYILYRAYSKDADYAANAQRAVNHQSAFTGSITAKTSTDAAVTENASVARGA